MKRYKRHFLSIILLLSILPVIARAANAQVIAKRDLRPDPNGMPGEQRCERVIDIGPNVKFNAVVGVTAKGNGILKVANLSLKVYDDHDDGAVYVGEMLHVEFVDITGDGFKDLIITGTVKNTGENESDIPACSTVAEIYVFDPAKNEFKLAFQYGPSLAS